MKLRFDPNLIGVLVINLLLLKIVKAVENFRTLSINLGSSKDVRIVVAERLGDRARRDVTLMGCPDLKRCTVRMLTEALAANASWERC